ncbi:hypothetical protein HDU84_003321 [Entophlyctis sp. JEL0112]|nr:hypothetical protein HDU84_003321 [Entophlyctis sp. JEL0112]
MPSYILPAEASRFPPPPQAPSDGHSRGRKSHHHIDAHALQLVDDELSFRRAYEGMLSLTQVSSVRAYALRFRQLALVINLDEDALCRLFVGGLKRGIRTELSAMRAKPLTLDATIEAAESLESFADG